MEWNKTLDFCMYCDIAIWQFQQISTIFYKFQHISTILDQFFTIFVPDQLDSIVERMVLEADLDGDDLISFDEFCKVLHRIDVEKKMSIRILS